MEHGFIEEETAFFDGTHVKASANNHKYRKEIVEKSSKYYEEELRKEINADREAHGKKPLKDDPEETPETKENKSSTTDPDCGFFHKGEHKKVFAYGVNVACDSNNYVLGFEIDAGNIHDSVIFPRIYERIIKSHPDIKNVVLDAGFKTPAIARQIIKDGRTPVMPYKRPMTKEGFFKKYEYVYDEYYDCYICPNNSILAYSTTNRDGYKEYKSNPAVCASCPYLIKCTQSKNHVKLVTRHIWEEYIEQVEDIRHTTGMKEIYDKRKETIERVFADAKELHGMRYAKHRGINRVRMELNLLFACMNLKKLAKRLWKDACFLPFLLRFIEIYAV